MICLSSRLRRRLESERFLISSDLSRSSTRFAKSVTGSSVVNVWVPYVNCQAKAILADLKICRRFNRFQLSLRNDYCNANANRDG